jgi:hypothetical protein
MDLLCTDLGNDGQNLLVQNFLSAMIMCGISSPDC